MKNETTKKDRVGDKLNALVRSACLYHHPESCRFGGFIDECKNPNECEYKRSNA